MDLPPPREPAPARRVHVLLNPSARRVDAAAVERAYAAWRDRVADLRTETCSEPRELADRAREAAATSDVVVAAGGDGTVSAVASGLAGGSVPLGVLPLGTFNHFARDLGVAGPLDAAVATTVTGAARPVDLGLANATPFLNTATLGAYVEVVRARERWEPRIGRAAAMAVATLAVVRRPPLLDIDVAAGGRRVRGPMPVVWVGNNRHAVRWPRVGRRGRLDEGTLTLVLFRNAGRWALLAQVLRTIRGEERVPDIDVGHAPEVSVTSGASSLSVVIDGERQELATPLVLRSWPAALLVVAPPASHPATGSPEAPSRRAS